MSFRILPVSVASEKSSNSGTLYGRFLSYFSQVQKNSLEMTTLKSYLKDMSENMYVYIITNQSHSTFYVWVTNNLERRILEHRQKLDPNSFSARYNLTKLVYYETDGDAEHAILREKQIKDYRREKKIALIEKQNPYYKDLSGNWYH